GAHSASGLPGPTAMRRLATQARSCRAASRRPAVPSDPPSCSMTPSPVGHDARQITVGWYSSRSVGCQRLAESSLGHLDDGQRLDDELRVLSCAIPATSWAILRRRSQWRFRLAPLTKLPGGSTARWG